MSINSLNGQTNEFSINKQIIDEKIKTNPSKGLESVGSLDESVGILDISYFGEESDTKYNLSARSLSEYLEKIESMINSLGSGLSGSVLEEAIQKVMSILKGITNLAAQMSTTAPEGNASPTTVDNLLKNSDLSSLDIRGLMKLLIQAFSQFFTTQRSLDLNTINQIEAAMEAKIAAMEKEKDEAYKAAMSQAIGSIVSGAMSIGAGLCSCVGAIGSSGKVSKIEQNAGNTEAMTAAQKAAFAEAEAWGQGWNSAATTLSGVGKIAEGVAGIASAEHQSKEKDAQIEQTKQDAVLEILKKMQNDGSDQAKQLMDFISRLLSMIQELQQSAAQTEKTIVQA